MTAARAERLFEHHRYGTEINVDTLLDGGLAIGAVAHGTGASVELTESESVVLIEALVRWAAAEGIGETGKLAEQLDELQEVLGATEDARDQQTERADRLERELQARLADLEQARTALDIADRRAREAEAELDGRYPTVTR